MTETPSEVFEVTFLTRLTELTICFQGLGDEVFDVLRRGASIGRDDGDGGVFEIWKEIQPESRERNHPDDDQDQGDHGRRNAAFDGKIRELHG